jgi:hypothetical protein
MLDTKDFNFFESQSTFDFKGFLLRIVGYWKWLIDNNFWIEYFLQCPMYQKDNWIDFESEISKVIQSLDQDMKDNNFKLEDNVSVVNKKGIFFLFR